MRFIRADVAVCVKWTKTALRRVRQFMALVVPTIALIRSCRNGKLVELWVGDSHAVFFNQCGPVSSRLTRIDDHRFVWHFGPRLMWTFADKGFPPDILLIARLIRRIGRSRHFSLIVILGEIDVRVHLAGSQNQSRRSMAFVSEYVKQCQLMGRMLGAGRVLIAIPVPPGSLKGVSGYPRSGTLAERIDMFKILREALVVEVNATEAQPTTLLLDCTNQLSDCNGSLLDHLTDDGCHVNDIGAEIVRACFLAVSPSATTSTVAADHPTRTP